MEFVPFVYFTLLTLYWWKKHQGLDVCVYMSSMYAFTSLLCVINVNQDMLDEGGILFDRYDLELSIIPTVLYCGFLTLGMLPFSMVYKKDIQNIATPNPKIIALVSWFLIAISLLNFYLVADSTLEILSGDLSTIRANHYNGIESPAMVKAESMPFIIRFLYYFNISTLLSLPLFFYYLCFDKKPWWFYTLMLFASLSMPLAGIQSADRTEMVFYAIMFISCIIFFHRFMSKKAKRIMKLSMIPVGVGMVVYLTAVTVSRFASSETGATGNIVQYAGQNYLNFCFFWEKGRFEYVTAERELPLTYHYAFHIDNDDYRRSERSGKQGFFMSVFASYIGDIMLDLSPIGMIIWCIIYFLVSLSVIKRPHREKMSVGEYVTFFALSVIPLFGIFYYRYMSYTYTFMLGIVAFLYVTDKFKIVYE
ncbi:MAG: oligosaccharide repeat unit polymerase [Prevotella sp.]|nr:oligosaccharide repeat unit polymerase [Prevotella sp.]